MKSEVKKLPRGQAELVIELSAEEYQPFLQQAAKKISESTKIPGFRPGKAGFELIKQKIGEGELWQEALEPAIKKTFISALDEQKIDSVGQPQIDVIKLAPGNPVIYKATLSLLPAVTLADYTKIKVAAKPVTVSPEQIKKTLTNFQKMYAKETLVDRAAKTGDKVEIDLEVFADKVPIEHGKQDKMNIVLGEGNFIPGFEDQIAGLAKDAVKEFELKFPANYHQKNLAGKPAEFKVKVNAVYNLELPELNDEFAKTLGHFKNLKEIKEKIEENLKAEVQGREDARQEEEIFDALISQSKIDDLPDILINSEGKKMLEELEHNVGQQGLKFDDYLTQLKKTREQLLLDFVPLAIKRVKSALIVRQIGLREKIEVSDQEVEDELHKTIHAYGHDPEVEKNLNTPAYRAYLRNVLSSKKIINRLKEIIVK